jgi:hypothetical protein
MQSFAVCFSHISWMNITAFLASESRVLFSQGQGRCVSVIGAQRSTNLF